MPERRPQLTPEAAEIVAIDALSFLATEPEILSRFMALTGIEPASLRRAAANPTFLTGVLDYFLSDEGLLVRYAANAGIPADEIDAARRALSTTDEG